MLKFRFITKLTCLILGFVFLQAPLKSQITLYSPTGGIVGLPDTADMGDTLDFSYYLINQGPVPLTNFTIISLMQVNGNLLPVPVDTQVVNIWPTGDTVQIDVSDFIVGPQNQNNGGANIMVIWPANPGNDSLRDTMHVRDPNFLEPDQGDNPKWTVFPNPANEQLNFSLDAVLGFLPEELFLIDFSGRIIAKFKGLPRTISIEGLPPGLYLVELRLNDGRRFTKKVIKS